MKRSKKRVTKRKKSLAWLLPVLILIPGIPPF